MKRVRVIPDKEFNAHCYITWKTWSWKSSLVEQWIYNQRIKNSIHKDRCIIVIDPHGEMVERLRKLRFFNKDRSKLIYLDPLLWKDHTFCLNPFEAIEELLPDTKLSTNMKALLKPCIYVLLSVQWSSLKDLQNFLSKEESIWKRRWEQC